MTHLPLSRRRFLEGTGGVAAAALAARPRLALSANGRILRMVATRDIQVLDPGYMIGDREITLQYMCLGRLADYAPGDRWAWQPSAYVTRLEQPDERTIEFTLREGLLWTGGFGEMTTEDVKYSFERMKTTDWNGKWEALDHVEIVDQLRGVLRFKEPFAPIWYTTICDGTGSILCKQAMEAAGGRYTTEFPAMCGPYNLTRWVPQQRIELVRNPDWPGPPPEVEEVHFLIITDEKSAEIAYEAGEVDLTNVSADSLARYAEQPPPDSTLVVSPGLRFTFMAMNTEHPKLQDIRVRKAIQLAVDVDAILAAAYGGMAPRAHGIVPPGLIGHRTTSAIEKRDVERAKALLAEAGVSDLSLELKVLNQQDRLIGAQVIQANLGEVGIDVQITPLDSGPFWNLGQESQGDDWRDLQLWTMRYGDAPDPSQMLQWFIKSQVGVWNWERWSDPEFEALFEQGLRETDERKRHDLYIRAQEIMEETGAYVWITHEPPAILHRNTVEPVIYPNGQLMVPWFKWA